MRYEILLADGAVLLLQITTATFKTWKVWKIQFTDGREAMLYKCGDEWVQRNEDQLDNSAIIAIGKCIDGIGKKNDIMTV
ncbi:hypothetical protein [Mucilaginibacter sp.]|uniref:hypothetical protein n=1 Tax=Mucilaginibacter sp. TaxID=1882438 RepID=UPI0025E24177|nr:hypothetical protein [Mucilaginibacter sp.]